MDGREVVASLAAASASSLPGIKTWLGSRDPLQNDLSARLRRELSPLSLGG